MKFPSTRSLATVVWAGALLFTAGWWALSYRYGIGFAASGPPLAKTVSSRHATPRSGIALVSGVGKAIVYVSWSSAFTRQGIIFEPVLAHEFPHPWFGFQKEGGRLWFSFPIGCVFGLTVAANLWSHTGRFRKSQHH